MRSRDFKKLNEGLQQIGKIKDFKISSAPLFPQFNKSPRTVRNYV